MDHDIRSNWRSVWVKRPDYHGRTVRAVNGVHVDACAAACLGPDGAMQWAIRSGENSCLDKDGDWIIEPLPSRCDERFYHRCRFDALEAAYAFAVSWLEIDIICCDSTLLIIALYVNRGLRVFWYCWRCGWYCRYRLA